MHEGTLPRELANVASAASDDLALLAGLHDRELSIDSIRQLAAESPHNWFALSLTSEDSRVGFNLLAEYLAQFASQSEDEMTLLDTLAADYADLDASDIAFHPVRAIVSCDGGAVPGATVATTADTAPSSTVPAVDGALCYVLGPEGGNGSQVRDAKVYADGVGIEVSVREDDVASMNLLFNACYLAIAACPASSAEGKGYVAVVVDGKVVSTPAIDEEDLASSPFVITGDFDQRQAADIATAINDR